jgi:hypothetical protein
MWEEISMGLAGDPIGARAREKARARLPVAVVCPACKVRPDCQLPSMRDGRHATADQAVGGMEQIAGFLAQRGSHNLLSLRRG